MDKMTPNQCFGVGCTTSGCHHNKSHVYDLGTHLQAVIPRAGSSSQRKLYRHLEELYPDAARRKARKIPVHGIIRDPYARLESAYRYMVRRKRRKPYPSISALTRELVETNIHFCPQAEFPRINGWEVTEWQSFDDFIKTAEFHENATPKVLKSEIKVEWTPEFNEWFLDRYSEDIAIYERITK